jgi:SAM-dependent methyltransferase
LGSSRSRETTAYDRALLEFLNSFGDHDEQWAGGMQREVAARLAVLARPASGDTCLDIGGGSGIVATALSAAVGAAGSVISLGGSGVEVTSPSTLIGHRHLIQPIGDEIIFRDHTFDVVVLSRSIAYASDPYAVIGEAIRILRPGGRLALFCRREGLATPAEQAFLDELGAFLSQQPVSLPHQFVAYSGPADRRALEMALRMAGLEGITFGDVVTGGRAPDAAAFNREMMGCWPAARILFAVLAGRKRLDLEARIERAMTKLGDDAFRYHHPYLLAAGTRPAYAELLGDRASTPPAAGI